MTVDEAKRIVDKHYRLLAALQGAYKSQDYTKAERQCKADIKMYEAFILAYKYYETNYVYRGNSPIKGISLPMYPAFLTLAKIYEKQELYGKAVDVCDLALRYNLSDGTQGGFEGRKAKLLKKLNT